MKFKKALLFIATITYCHCLFSQSWQEKFNQPSDRNFYEITRAFNTAWENKEITSSTKGYKQFKRWEWFWKNRINPDGTFPNPMHVYMEWKKINEHSSLGKSPSPANWSFVGPNSIPQATEAAYAGMGRVNTIAFDPTNTNKIWAGSAAGGLWVSTNGGTSWATSTDLLPTLGISDIVINPNNSNIMYIATGDADADHTYSVGVMKSIDGGSTWNTTNLNYNITQTRQVASLLIDPVDPSILIAAASDGIYITQDEGNTWTQKISGTYFKDLEFNPSNSDVIYAGSNNGEIHKSTDNGNSWSKITAGLPSNAGRVVLAVTPANADYVYAIIDDKNGSLEGLYRSTDAGNNWSLQYNSSDLLGGQGGYDQSIAVAPNNENLLYAGGVDLFKSNDGGITWTQVTNGTWVQPSDPGVYVHSDHHMLKFAPGSSTDLFSAHDGGIHKVDITNDAVWTDLSAGLQITQYYRMAGTPQNANYLLAGAQDNDVTHYNGSTWHNRNNNSDGMECLFDYSNSDIAYTCSQQGYITRTMDNFATMSTDITASNQGTWTIPLVMDPTDPKTLYAGYEEIYKTTDRGDSWTPITNGESFNLWELIAVAPSNSNTLYISANDYNTGKSEVFVTSNGGSSWSSISNGLPTDKYLTYIAVNATNPQEVYVTLGGYTAGEKVYKSTNGGTSWTNLSGSLPNIPIKCIVYQSGSLDDIYIGTDLGVYHRNNTMSDWAAFNTGLPNVIVNELEIHYSSGKIRAATFGRGIWESNLNSASSIESTENNVADFEVIPNPTKGQFIVKMHELSENATITVYNVIGGVVEHTPVCDLSTRLDLTSYSPGSYFVSLKNGKAIYSKKIMLVK